MIIKRVDQRDKATCLRLKFQIQLGDVSDDDRVKILSELQIITSAQSPIAQFIKAGKENLSTSFFKRDVSSEMRESF